MGMFNWLEVYSGVPKEIQGEGWQTKDVEPNTCGKLKITDTGYLMRQHYKMVIGGDYPLGFTKIPTKWVHLVNFNGTISMIVENDEGDWIRYEAEFTNGQLDRVRKL